MDSIRRDLDELHPAIRDSVKSVLAQLAKEKIPFRVFEAFRLPSRQRYLYNQGRTTPGKKVTFQDAWGSFHQYGLAADFVLFEGGEYSWNTTGKRETWWKRLHEVGEIHGLVPVSFEMPHLQIAGLSTSDLRAGRFPTGDQSWEKALRLAIDNWPDGAPPVGIFVDKPPLNDGLPSEHIPNPQGSETDTGSKHSPGTQDLETVDKEAMSLANFELAQEVVREFEGGYALDPKDPGGATNFGITHITLAKWRKVPFVTAEQVKQMSYQEAKLIYRANYWDINSCGQMPLPLGLVAYNVGVHCGTATAANYLQRALNKNGASLKIDGDIGDNTLGAVALINKRQVIIDMIALYEERLRGHKDFEHFKGGFLKRIAKLRDTSLEWLGDLETAQQKPAPKVPAPQTDPIGGGNTMIAELNALKEQLAAMQLALAKLIAANTNPVINLAMPAVQSVETTTQYPVTNALGSTIGGLLDGKKTAIGLIGSLATSIVGGASSDGFLSKLGGVFTEALPALGSLSGMSGPLLPAFLAMTAWGGLSKMEKWLAPLGGVKPTKT